MCQKTSVFRFWCSLRFADFSFCSIRFSVFVENNSGFSVLLSNMVCIRFWPKFLAVLRFCMIFSSALRFLIYLNVPLYIQGTWETIVRILRPYNICVAHKPMFILRRLLTNVNGKDKPEDRLGAIYKIKCSDCQATYIGETGKNLTTPLNKHKRATKRITSTITSPNTT